MSTWEEHCQIAVKERDALEAKLALAVEALRKLTNSAETYMHYHAKKFYGDESAATLIGLYPAIADAREALAKVEEKP